MHAVVFDLDGVLVDSEPLWDEVRRGVAARAGRPWPAEATTAIQGMSTPEWARYLAERVGISAAPARTADQVIETMAERYRAGGVPFITGAQAAVRRLGAAFPLGLASSSPRRLIDAVLEAGGLSGCFRVTVSTEEVAAGKPDPAVYREVTRRLGGDPGATAAIEDSSNGLRSAAAAGLVVVAVPHAAFPPAPDALALAAATLTGLAELTVPFIGALGEAG